MAGTVMDISTCQIIEDAEAGDCQSGTGEPGKRVFEISGPDGRTVFSIERLLDGYKGNAAEDITA